MPRTKKTPTSQSLAARATKGPKETPKGSGPSLQLHRLPSGLWSLLASPAQQAPAPRLRPLAEAA